MHIYITGVSENETWKMLQVVMSQIFQYSDLPQSYKLLKVLQQN